MSPTKHLVNIRDGGDLIANIVECFAVKIDELHGSNEVAGIGPVTVSPSSSQRPIVTDIRTHFSVSDDFKTHISVDDSQDDKKFQNFSSSFSSNPVSRTSQDIRFSNFDVPTIVPSQKIRIDHAQMTLHSFVQASEKPSNSTSIISFSNDSTRTSQAMKKIPILVPVVIPVHTTIHTMFRIVSFIPVMGFIEEKLFSTKKIYYSYINSANGKSKIVVFEIVNHETFQEKNEKPQLRQLCVPDSYLVYSNLSVENLSRDFPTVEKVIQIVFDPNIGWKKDSDEFWTEKIRKSVNVKISRVDEANYIFFQYKAEFFVTPFFVVLQEYIFQV